MPPVRADDESGPLGFILPPMLNGSVSRPIGSNEGTTAAADRGSTSWITGLSRQAESLGAAAVWATDHLFWGAPTLECVVTATVAATATRRAAVGTCVLQLPLRAPAAVAKQASTLQCLSGGRFVLGVGAGSHPREFELAGAEFSTRGAQLDAGIDSVRRAWATDEDGYRHEPALPAPIWVGGSSRSALRRAARAADGWVPLFVDAPSMADAIAELRSLAVAAGRPADAVTPAVVVMVSVGADAARAADRGSAWLASLYGIPAKAFGRHLVAGSPERCAGAVRRYLGAGAAHVAVMVAGDDPMDQFAQLASAVTAQREMAELAEVGA